MSFALVLLLATGLPAVEPPTEKPELWAGITVNTPTPTAGGPFMMLFSVINDSQRTIDPGLGSSQLFINGQELKTWSLTIGNGPRDGRWNALPPGDNLQFGYALGDAFAEPGRYKVRWKGKGFNSAEIEFRVLPKAK